ncbi:cycloheximide resistance protein, partial [Colletotrichum cuscutae]
ANLIRLSTPRVLHEAEQSGRRSDSLRDGIFPTCHPPFRCSHIRHREDQAVSSGDNVSCFSCLSLPYTRFWPNPVSILSRPNHRRLSKGKDQQTLATLTGLYVASERPAQQAKEGMPSNQLGAVQGSQPAEKQAVESSEWRSSDDKTPEEVTCFLTEEHEDVEATADQRLAPKTSQLEKREPFDPVLWSSRKKWTHVLVVGFITCVTPLASAVYTPALDQVIGDFKIEDNPTLADLTVSAYVLGFSAGPLLLAPLSETFGKKPVYQVCNVVLLACNLACMVAPSAEWLIVFRFLAGCAGASPITQGTGTATDVMTKEKCARAMSVMAFGSVCSPAIGSALGGAIAQAWGWRGCFGSLAVMVWLYIDVPMTYKAVYSFNTAEAGLAFAGMGVGMFTGLLIFGFLTDVVVKRLARGGERLPERRLPLLNLAAILVVVGLIIYNLAARPGVSYLVPLLGNYLIGSGLFAITMTLAVYIIDLSPQHAVASSASLALLRYPSGALFPLLEHAFESLTSNSSAKWLITAASVSTIPLVVWLQYNCERFRVRLRDLL